MSKNDLIPSVNFHLWEPCNMRCKFCFATFQDVKQVILPKGHVPKSEAIEIIREIAGFGFKKITFAGGEPMLCPWLPELIKEAKDLGLITMLVSNGSRLTNSFLNDNKDYLDWITLSIDSLCEITNLSSGRAISGKKVLKKEYYEDRIKKIHQHGYRLKINTVVNKLNFDENMVDFIKRSRPKRWKVLQVLPIKNQNDRDIKKFMISNNEFQYFLKTHHEIQTQISECNDEIKGSYVMIDPAGRFFDNSEGKHNYSDPVLAVGVDNAYNQVNYSLKKFIDRKGLYF